MNLLTQIKHKTQKGEEVIMDIGAKASNVLPENFVEQKERSNLAAKDKLPVIFGKLSKWYADLRPVAWSGSYSDLTNKPTIPEGSAANYQVANNDTTEAEGFVADARIVRTHGLEIDGLSRDLGAVPEFVIDKSTGKITGYKTKAGADTVFPFSSTPLLNMKFSQMPKVDYYTSTNLVFENPGYNRLKVTDCNANYWWVYNCPWFDVNNWGNELETKYQIGKRNDTVFDITNAKYVLIHTKQSENNNSGFGGCKFNLCNE